MRVFVCVCVCGDVCWVFFTTVTKRVCVYVCVSITMGYL